MSSKKDDLLPPLEVFFFFDPGVSAMGNSFFHRFDGAAKIHFFSLAATENQQDILVYQFF